MSLAIKAKFEAQKEIAFGAIDANYSAIGTAFTNTARVIFIDNFTDVALQFSFDGVNDHFIVWGPGGKAIDVTANRSDVTGELYFPVGQIVYVKTIAAFGAPSSGSAYISLVYGQ